MSFLMLANSYKAGRSPLQSLQRAKLHRLCVSLNSYFGVIDNLPARFIAEDSVAARFSIVLTRLGQINAGGIRTEDREDRKELEDE